LSVEDPPTGTDDEIVGLVPVVRRVLAARMRDPHVVEDLVQETIARVVASRARVQGSDLAPYAVATARNLVATYAERNDRAREKAHLLVDMDVSDRPGDRLLRQEDRIAVLTGLSRLSADERDLLLAHEVNGESTASLAESRNSTPGAVAAQLARIRARLRVEYLLIQESLEPPTEKCRPVLQALSAGDRRRARKLDAAGHLLACPICSRLSSVLSDRRGKRMDQHAAQIRIDRDADVVTARHRGREIAAANGFSPTDCTVIATAISEVARNIVKFARHGVVIIEELQTSDRRGIRVTGRDAGPGIPDIPRALQDGFSTYQGLGLGLPGCRRLMDEFELESRLGEGTTVTMTKWTDE
jgi:serine/threonine-protein kinase RsbT